MEKAEKPKRKNLYEEHKKMKEELMKDLKEGEVKTLNVKYIQYKGGRNYEVVEKRTILPDMIEGETRYLLKQEQPVFFKKESEP